VELQSADLEADSTRARGHTAQLDAADHLVAASPRNGRRRSSSDELARRPGQAHVAGALRREIGEGRGTMALRISPRAREAGWGRRRWPESPANGGDWRHGLRPIRPVGSSSAGVAWWRR
jgi:hypothetical protein